MVFPSNSGILFRLLATASVCGLVSAHAESVQLEWMVQVTDGRSHCAFTDLTFFQDRYYLCFRKGRSHNSTDGEIHILRSQDLKTWETVKVLRTLGDDRDPHFVIADGELYVYFGVWDLRHGEGPRPVERGQVRSHFSKTSDGKSWSAIQAVYEPGWWLWRVRYLNGRFYSGAYTALRPTPATRETRLVSSEDGLDWSFVETVSTRDGAGEADLWSREDGSFSLLSRTAGNAIHYRSDRNLRNWKSYPLQGAIHAPVVARWKDRFFVAGRGRGPDGFVTRLWEFFEDRVEERLTLPSGGDTSYCGLIVDPVSPNPDCPALYISWYAQRTDPRDVTPHGGTASVYVGRIVFEP